MDIEEFKKLKEQYKKTVKTEGKKLFAEHMKNTFDQLPTLKKIRWTQYTPYFSDGDACVFSVYDFIYQFDGDISDEEFEEDGYDLTKDWYDPKSKYGKSPIASKEIYKALKEFEEHPFDEDVFQEIFGDHVEVTASKNKKGEIVFNIEKHEHD